MDPLRTIVLSRRSFPVASNRPLNEGNVRTCALVEQYPLHPPPVLSPPKTFSVIRIHLPHHFLFPKFIASDVTFSPS